jgi:hypothetical protein
MTGLVYVCIYSWHDMVVLIQGMNGESLSRTCVVRATGSSTFEDNITATSLHCLLVRLLDLPRLGYRSRAMIGRHGCFHGVDEGEDEDRLQSYCG